METPTISGSTYSSQAINLAAMGIANGLGQATQQFFLDSPATTKVVNHRQEIFSMASPTRRLVQVFIADPNENIPLDKSLLYTGDQKLTDATDQELFFEIDIKGILDKHNAERVKMVDKKVKERTEYLEPAKIRDLKMVVVTVAGF